MYFKMVLSNIRKSFKDYAIYFITLTLAVCIFYNFNTIEHQIILYDVAKSHQGSAFQYLDKIIYYLSIFISVILCGLIVYANNILVKKRKREFGIYSTLGMSKVRVSQILVSETVVVGVISLILGLLLGVVLSQGISVFVGNLFEFDMSKYKFMLSIDAIIKTVIYFAIMFLLVGVFNTTVILKHKLIDMLTSEKKNEVVKIRSTILSSIMTIIGIIIIGSSYSMGWRAAARPKDLNLPLSAILACFGTLLLFMGLGSFILAIVKKNKNMYLKNLNIFVIKQFSNKINTNFISMTIITIMLFITISMLSLGFGMKHKVEKTMANQLPFDASIESRMNDKHNVEDINEALKVMNFNIDNSYKFSALDVYISNTTVRDLILEYADSDLKKELSKSLRKVECIKLAQYNEMRKVKGESPITLKENEVKLISSEDNVNKALTELKEHKKEIKLDGKSYNIKEDINSKETYRNSQSGNPLTLIVNDDVIKGMELQSSIMNINSSKKDKQELDDKINELNKKIENQDVSKETLMMEVISKTVEQNNTKSTVGTILYIGIYFGFVFLISSAAVLAIQQLTEASDSIDRYRVLKNIGVPDEMINKSIFVQILVHFSAPIIVALIHCIAGFKILDKALAALGGGIYSNTSVLIVSGTIIVLYGVYFYSTYLGYKNTVNIK